MDIALAILGVLFFAVTIALLGLATASQITLGLLRRVIDTRVLKPAYAADLEGAVVDGRRLLYVSLAATAASASSAAIVMLAIAFNPEIDDLGKLGFTVVGLLILWAVGYLWMKVSIRWLTDAIDELGNARRIVAKVHAKAAADA